MRITRETLLKASQDVVNQRVRTDRGIIAVYLVGSLLGDNPLLGGATDIDLVFIHDSDPVQEREIGRLNSDITLDIAHHRQADYKHPRNLRVQPWLGPSVFSTRVVFHDTQHWFEFTQASVTSQFNRPENVINRARPQLELARQLWLEIAPNTNNHLKNLLSYLKAIKTGANAIASLSGAPLTDRRFMLNFPERAQAIGKPGLASGLLGLLGADHASADQARAWLPFWQGAMQAIEGLDDIPVSLHPYRRPYYERAFGAILSGDQPLTALWSMLWTWTQAINSLPAGSPHLTAWQEACFNLKLGPEQFDEKYSALDAFLDNIEEILEVWSRQNGV